MGYRVLHSGTGNAGKLALRGVIQHPDLELVGVLAFSPEKVGKDAGELAGTPPTGVHAIGDLDEALALDVDCLCYLADGLRYPQESVDLMARFLASGRNVVTTSILPMVYPPTAAPELRDPIEAACKEGGTTFFCNGADPGFASDLVPVTLLSIMDDLERVRIQEIIDYSYYDQPETMEVVLGFGQPLDYDAQLFSSGALTQFWGGVVRLIADKLGVELEEIRETHERVAMDRDIEITVGPIPAGTTAASRFDVQGIVNGKPVICVEHYTRVHQDAAPDWPSWPSGENGYRVLLEGRPNLVCAVTMSDEHGGDGSLIANGMRVVNAIPFVCDTEPGILDTLGIPHAVTRNLRF